MSSPISSIYDSSGTDFSEVESSLESNKQSPSASIEEFGHWSDEVICEESEFEDLALTAEMDTNYSMTARKFNNRNIVITKIEGLMNNLLADIHQNIKPTLYLAQRRAVKKNIKNRTGTHAKLINKSPKRNISLLSAKSARIFAVILRILEICHGALVDNIVLTKREIFYRDVALFETQNLVDRIIEDIACTLLVPRSFLNVIASSKGLVSGNIHITKLNGGVIDCTDRGSGENQGYLIPSMDQILDLELHASFILIVEEEATFRHLISSRFCSLCGPYVLITGKGYPDLVTRQFIRMIIDRGQNRGASKFTIPVLCLMDNDPYGVEIFTVYKYGSMSMAFDKSNLSIPEANWIGLHYGDRDRSPISLNSLLPMSKYDMRKGYDLLTRSEILEDKRLVREISQMLHSHKKAELQAISSNRINGLCQYLKEKLRDPELWL